MDKEDKKDDTKVVIINVSLNVWVVLAVILGYGSFFVLKKVEAF